MKEKYLNKESGQETTGFFPVVSMCWHTPLIHVVTVTKSFVTSHVTEMWVLTKSLRSPSRCGGDQATYNLLLAELAKDCGSPEKKFVRGLISTTPGW